MTTLTAREIAAAATGGALDERIPDAELRKRLANEPGSTLDADRILPVLANAVGWYRMARALDENRLSRQEVADQARDTAAVAGDLLARLASMHPDLAAPVDDALYRLRGTHALALRDALAPYLALVQAALRAAESEMRAGQARRGPKRASARNSALRRAYEAIRAHSTPRMSREAARALAGDLLRLCEPGMPMPTDRNELARIMRG